MAMVQSAQPRGGVNTGLVGGTGLDGSPAPALSNLETIIAATVRAVTGQLSGLDGSADGSMLRRDGNPSAMPGMDMTSTASAAFAANRWSGHNVVGADGIGGGSWCGGDTARWPGMPSADAVRSGLLASDNDPNTLYVGNVR